jgi:hypothetical protein
MASPNIYSGGLNLTGTVFENGPSLLQLMPAYVSGAIQWVDTIGGNNSNAGTDPELPVATLAQALTNSATSGIVIIGEGSAETVSSQLNGFTAGMTVVGCGSGSTRPRYTAATSANDMFSASAAGVRFRNLYFPASTAAVTSRISITGINSSVRDCYFECGANDTSKTVLFSTGSSGGRVEGCTFAVTASRPAIGLLLSATLTDITVSSTVFDGGSYGWTDYAFKTTGTVTRLFVESVNLRNRSDFGITVTGTTYQLYGLTNDGTSRAVITA